MGVVNGGPPVTVNRPLRAKVLRRRRAARLPGKPEAMNGTFYRPGLRAATPSVTIQAPAAQPNPAITTPPAGAAPVPSTIEAKEGARAMTREQLTEKILDIKREKGWTWKYITDEIGGMSPVLIVGALLGQHKLVKPLARAAAQLFELSPAEERMLNEVPMRGAGVPMPPTDPLIYRFYELVMINGPAWKALVEEEFGDGIMSAIDFDFEMERLPDPKGDRVKIGMSGKFLPYKYFGASQDTPPLGLRDLDQ
jgi:cyanate lyase